MMTVKEVSERTGVSIRTLHHYDAMGLLPPVSVTDAGYRMYDDASIERLQMILLFRELEFSLKDIRDILESPDFDRNRAIEQQIEMLEAKKQHLENVIAFARGIHMLGVKYMNFSAFDSRKIDDYSAQAKTLWGKTEAYREFEEKQKNYTKEDDKKHEAAVMGMFAELGSMRHLPPEDENVQAMIGKMRGFFTEHFYNCTPQILRGLGKMYAGGGAFTEKPVEPSALRHARTSTLPPPGRAIAPSAHSSPPRSGFTSTDPHPGASGLIPRTRFMRNGAGPALHPWQSEWRKPM